jgi:hypothetical protein
MTIPLVNGGGIGLRSVTSDCFTTKRTKNAKALLVFLVRLVVKRF